MKNGEDFFIGLFMFLALMFALFAGDPDIADAIIFYLSGGAL